MVFTEGEEIPRIVQAVGLGAVLLAIFLVIYGSFLATTQSNVGVINNTPSGETQAANTFAINFTVFGTASTLANNPSNKTFFVRIINSSVVLQNQTNRFTDPVDGFHVDPVTATIFIVDRGPINISAQGNTVSDAGLLNVSYTYVINSKAGNSIEGIIEAFANIAGFWDILAVGAMAGLILVVLLVLFPSVIPGGGGSEGKRM